MIKKITLITICLTLLISCGRKSEPKYEASINNDYISFNFVNKIILMPKKNEIYQ